MLVEHICTVLVTFTHEIFFEGTKKKANTTLLVVRLLYLAISGRKTGEEQTG